MIYEAKKVKTRRIDHTPVLGLVLLSLATDKQDSQGKRISSLHELVPMRWFRKGMICFKASMIFII